MPNYKKLRSKFLAYPMGYLQCFFSICLLFSLLPAQAGSSTVVVNGDSYNITLFEGQSFDTNASVLRTTPFWGDLNLANNFANAFALQVGVPDTSTNLDAVYFGFQESTFDFGNQVIPTVNTFFVDENGGMAVSKTLSRSAAASRISFASATSVPDAIPVPEIDAGAMSHALFILFVLWLHVRRWNKLTCA